MSDFQIHYQSDCSSCGDPVDDPFWDTLCFQCDHGRHSVAPWDAPDCRVCWPEVEDDCFDLDDYDVEPARDVQDVQVGGDVL